MVKVHLPGLVTSHSHVMVTIHSHGMVKVYLHGLVTLYSHIMVTLHLHSVSHNAPAWYGHICYMQSVLGVECLAPV